MIPLAAFALAACLAVGSGSDQIVAGDLVASLPEWASVPPQTPLGLAPAPGVQRVLRVPELRRLAERWKLPATDREVCVTRPAAPISSERMFAAMRKELPKAEIEILEFSRAPAPEGDLVFPLARLRQTPAGGYWDGYVAYAGKQRFSIWARVKVRLSVPRVIAIDALPQGVPVTAAQLRLEMRDEIPGAGFAASPEEIVGRLPKRSIVAGAALRTEWLDAPKAVLRGDTVQVEVSLGGTHLKLEAVAEASGVIGETIPIQNPTSKQRFPARIQAPGRVVVMKGSL